MFLPGLPANSSWLALTRLCSIIRLSGMLWIHVGLLARSLHRKILETIEPEMKSYPLIRTPVSSLLSSSKFWATIFHGP
jgi:hypothetical protein